ncbi:sensor histidine kinase [Paenibacillus sp. GCM10027627]|uniref:sensor histidine kinase n=1 Tax=unclassified Paenibacillus TaxID=185978 RepID=UPI003640B827
MIKKYVTERRSWIVLFVVLQLLGLLIVIVDSTIPLESMLYLLYLSSGVFILHFIIRYHKETRFVRGLEEMEASVGQAGIPEAETPFEKVIASAMTGQMELLKRAATDNRMALENEKDELLSWIHEVKTPLTAMRLMIDRMDDGAMKTGLTYEWLRIHLLLDQQLHQSRIPFMENDLYIETVDLESVIFDEIRTLQSWCIQKGIGFDLGLDEPAAISDAKWLAFTLRQLLTNAVKYSSASDIAVRSYRRGDGHIVLEVADCGRGIDPRDLPRIFDKGFTSTTVHRDSAATGMGLYLAQKAAQSLLIDIQVESRLGEGTTFVLTFPERNDFVQMTSM